MSEIKTGEIEIRFHEMDTAISVMREVAGWARGQGYRVWPDEWLTAEELITPNAQPENFCVGVLEGETACAFILQWADEEYGLMRRGERRPICTNSASGVRLREWA